MSAQAGEEHPHEIIIIRHGHGDHEEGHHGGVWKIAFADFMTAMMCFFLVMWLINASNEQTKAAVASYFNPVKLIDRNSSKKGLEDIGDGANSAGLAEANPADTADKGGADGQGGAGPATSKSSAESVADAPLTDDNLFANPYAVLAEIASETGTMQNISAKGEGGAQLSGPSTGASGGEAYRDPFAPDFWSQQVAGDTTEANAHSAAGAGADRNTDSSAPEVPADVAKLQDLAKEEAKPADAGEHAPSPEAMELARKIKQELAEAFKPGEKIAEGISVVATDKGVTISVTDQLDFGMFEIGSALPRRDTVLAMEKIAKTLNAEKGVVTVSGHTDGRPFKNESYDNWRLSTSRAHSAYYMLVRAGMDERRITEVAGYADRRLKVKDDAFAAANRRIEILLEVGG